MVDHAEKIGVFGGSFNPVHVGHLVLARDVLETAGLDRVLLMPCARPPHKPHDELADGRHRLGMLRLAVEGEKGLEVSDMELKREGISYTIDTITALGKRYPRAELTFLIGADSLFELHTWKDIDALLHRCRIRCFARPGFDTGPGQAARIRLPAPWPERLLQQVLTARSFDLSSSEIRRRIAAGRSIRFLVPDDVARYIEQHHLYREKESSKLNRS